MPILFSLPKQSSLATVGANIPPTYLFLGIKESSSSLSVSSASDRGGAAETEIDPPAPKENPAAVAGVLLEVELAAGAGTPNVKPPASIEAVVVDADPPALKENPSAGAGALLEEAVVVDVDSPPKQNPLEVTVPAVEGVGAAVVPWWPGWG